MATIDLGKIAITPEGQWSYGRYYEKLSLVIYNGQSYLSLRNTTGDNPETSRGDWMQITSRGESLYQMMVREGKFVGTEEEFAQQYLDSLKACADASAEVRAALSDILDETDRVRAEISEVMVEEDIRLKNEAKREAAEINRKNADITRGVEERNRQEAEQRREQSMQQIQNDAEIALAMAAEAQQKAEEAILNEEERVKAENQRKIDEATRIQSEEQRVNDEAMRRSREADRQESENIRQKNEGDRILAEREREEIMRNLVEELKALAANRFKIVDVLPEVGEFAVIYLVPSTTPSDNDVYDEWAYVSEKWEHIGSTRFEMDNYFTKEEVKDALDTKANIQHQHTVADITDFPELYYDATAFFTSGAYPSDKYEELLEAVRAKRTVYATIDEEGHVSYVFFMSSANSDGSSSRVLLTTIFADGGYLYINTFVLQQSGMTPLQESITGKADKATTLAGYGIGDAYTKSEVDTALEGKQDTLTAGNGISIEGNVISSSVAEVVDNIVNAGYVFAGVATPATDPSTPNAKVFYIANGKGTYEKFGGIEVTEDEVVVLKYDTAWHKVATGIASDEKLSELKDTDDRMKLLLGYNAARSVVNLELGVSGKYVQCASRSAVANSAFAISKPFEVEACSELLIKTGFNPSDTSHSGLDLTVIAIYEEIERQRKVQKKDGSNNPLYYVVTIDENGNETVTSEETTEDTGYPVYVIETYTETRYLPNNEDRFVAIPDSGYYVANIPQSCKVVISYKPGATDTTVIVEKHGAIANLISQVFGIYEHRTMVEAMVSLAARVDALEARQGLLGNATAGTLDVSELTKCLYPIILRGHGVPAASTIPDNLPTGLPWDGVPVFIGQLYINLDATSSGLYYAKGHDSVSDWKQA